MDSAEIQNQIDVKSNQITNATNRVVELANEITKNEASKKIYKTMIKQLNDAVDLLIDARKSMNTAKKNLDSCYSSEQATKKVTTLENIRARIEKKVESVKTIRDRAEMKLGALEKKIEEQENARDLLKENVVNWSKEVNRLKEDMNNLNV